MTTGVDAPPQTAPASPAVAAANLRDFRPKSLLELITVIRACSLERKGLALAVSALQDAELDQPAIDAANAIFAELIVPEFAPPQQPPTIELTANPTQSSRYSLKLAQYAPNVYSATRLDAYRVGMTWDEVRAITLIILAGYKSIRSPYLAPTPAGPAAPPTIRPFWTDEDELGLALPAAPPAWTGQFIAMQSIQQPRFLHTSVLNENVKSALAEFITSVRQKTQDNDGMALSLGEYSLGLRYLLQRAQTSLTKEDLTLFPGLKNMSASSEANLSAGDKVIVGRYLDARQYYAWIQWPDSTRELLGNIAWKIVDGNSDINIRPEKILGTPAYRIGRFAYMAKNKNSPRNVRLRADIDREIRTAWLRTFLSPDGREIGIQPGQADLPSNVQGLVHLALTKSLNIKSSPVTAIMVREQEAFVANFLVKLLIILHAGLKLYDAKLNFYVENLQHAVVRAFSHGGRVNIRIPAVVNPTSGAAMNPYALTDWLGITRNEKLDNTTPVFSRDYGTHSVDIGDNADNYPGTGAFVEVDGTVGANARRLVRSDEKVWGLNISAGGIGRMDYNSDTIYPDSGHGHLFILFRPPTAKHDGVLQVGVETSAPDGISMVGKEHGILSTQANADPESSFGGLKKDKIGDDDKDTTNAVRAWGRYVDLVEVGLIFGGDYLTRLNSLHDAFRHIQRVQGNITAYTDLIGMGRMLKNWADRSFKNRLWHLSGFSGSATAQPPGTDYGVWAYRYQSYTDQKLAGAAAPATPLITTQDSLLTYHTVSATDAKTRGAGDPPARLGQPLANLAYRTLAYRAIVANWLYPGDTSVAEVNSASGSGVVFGCSIRWQTLQNLLGATLARLARQLRVPQELLRPYITAALGSVKPGDLADVDVVLLESAFAFPDTGILLPGRLHPAAPQNAAPAPQDTPPEVQAAYRLNDMFSVPAIEQFFQTRDQAAIAAGQASDWPVQLDALRLRLRLADQLSWNDQSPDKLGFIITQGRQRRGVADRNPTVPDFSEPADVGRYAESTIDLYTQYYTPATPVVTRTAGTDNTSRGRSAGVSVVGYQLEDSERYMPPVVFFRR